MSTLSLITQARAIDPSSDGLTWAELFAELPTDPVSVFALLLVVGFFTMVVWAGRSRPGGGGSVPPAPT